MVAVGRWLQPNRVMAAGTVLSSSSAAAGQPLAWLKDQLRSKTARSAVGWDVTTGLNDKIDFTEAGVARVGTLAAGNYATGAAYATAFQTAMNVAPGATNTYTVTYDGSTGKLTVARNTGTNA